MVMAEIFFRQAVIPVYHKRICFLDFLNFILKMEIFFVSSFLIYFFK